MSINATCTSASRARVSGHSGERGAQTYGPIGVWRQRPQRGSRSYPVIMGEAPMKLNIFLHLYNLMDWPICPKMFLQNKYIVARLGTLPAAYRSASGCMHDIEKCPEA